MHVAGVRGTRGNAWPGGDNWTKIGRDLCRKPVTVNRPKKEITKKQNNSAYIILECGAMRVRARVLMRTLLNFVLNSRRKPSRLGTA